MIVACLEVLNLFGNEIGDRGAAILSDAISKTKTLQALDIGCNGIGFEGGIKVAEGIANNNTLENLFLYHNILNTSAATALAVSTNNNKTCWQKAFHRRPFANPVKPQRCTTEPVRPLDGINKDVGGVKLLLTTTSVYTVDCACICPLLKIQHHCLCPNGRCNPPLASHPPPTPLYTPFLML